MVVKFFWESRNAAYFVFYVQTLEKILFTLKFHVCSVLLICTVEREKRVRERE